jgi:hypothetical protein
MREWSPRLTVHSILLILISLKYAISVEFHCSSIHRSTFGEITTLGRKYLEEVSVFK